MPMKRPTWVEQARRRPLVERVSKAPPRILRPVVPEVEVKEVYKHMPELNGLSLDSIRKALGVGDPV